MAISTESLRSQLASKNIFISSEIVVASGKGELPSDDGLKALVFAAEKRGAVITPVSGKFCELIAVTSKMADEFGTDLETWPDCILGGTWKNYMTSVQRNISLIAPLLEEQIVSRLTEITYPRNFVFEFANVCNLACPICPRHYRKIQDGLMSIENAKTIIDDIAETNKEITLYPHYLGETLIHPDLLSLIDHVQKHTHLAVNIISNGVLLTEEVGRALLSRSLTSFHFSLHECDTAMQTGVPSVHAISAKNVLNFLRLADQLDKRSSLWVGVSMVPERLDEAAVEDFREFWQPLVNAVNIHSYLSPERTLSDPGIAEAFRDIYLPCSSPWEQPVISVDGAVLPCCWDYEHKMVMGNVFEDTFLSIYQNEKFEMLRQAMIRKEVTNYPVCVSCKKWADYLPAYRAIDMGPYLFQSNGTHLSFQTKQVESTLLEERLTRLRIVGSGRQHLPLHRGGRLQARRKRN